MTRLAVNCLNYLSAYNRFVCFLFISCVYTVRMYKFIYISLFWNVVWHIFQLGEVFFLSFAGRAHRRSACSAAGCQDSTIGLQR